MRNFLIAVFVFLSCAIVFGVSEGSDLGSVLRNAPEPAGDPVYAAPTGDQAMIAFRRGFEADRLKRKLPTHVVEVSDGAPAWQENENAIQRNHNAIGNKNYQKAYDALQDLQIVECNWKTFDKRNVAVWAGHRVAELPAALYQCDYDLHYQIRPPIGEKLMVPTSGYFYMVDNGRYHYFGHYAHPY